MVAASCASISDANGYASLVRFKAMRYDVASVCAPPSAITAGDAETTRESSGDTPCTDADRCSWKVLCLATGAERPFLEVHYSLHRDDEFGTADQQPD